MSPKNSSTGYPSNASTEASGFHPYHPGDPPKAEAPVMRPTPLPKNPKGRWFVGLILLAVCAFAIYQVWTSFFRYRAYGTVVGRTVEVSAPWDGVVQAMHVREGDRVRQGQLLLTVENMELRQKHAQLGDELKIAQANLSAEVAKLKWQSASQVVDRYQLGIAEYYEAWGTLLQEQSRLDELGVALSRARDLYERRAISMQELDQVRYSKEGQEKKIEKLKTAVETLKKRMDMTGGLLQKAGDDGAGLSEQGHDQLKPLVARIEALQAELTRSQERLACGQVRAGTNGVVVKTHRHVGEHCKIAEPVMSILEEDSLQVVLYLPQNSSSWLSAGKELDLVVEASSQGVSGQVTRLGDQYEPAPEHIQRHYRQGEKLLPVYLQPKLEMSQENPLRMGGVVKLSY